MDPKRRTQQRNTRKTYQKKIKNLDLVAAFTGRQRYLP